MKKLISLFALALFAAGGVLQANDFPKGSPPFLTNYDKALAAAKENGKPVIIVFSTIYCAPCQEMKKTVYPSDEVKAYHDKFNWVYLDAFEPESDAARKKFTFEFVPHIGFLNKNGKKVDEVSGFNDSKDLAKKLKGVLEKVNSPAPTGGIKSK